MVSTRLQSTTGGDNEGSSRGVRHGNGPHVSHELTPYSAHPSSPHPSQQYVSNTHFLDLPSDCMEKIFGYLGYKQVSQLRLVCKQMDRVCSAILNSTFQKLQTQMLHRFQDIKSKMPRRESARRNHPLACESDIIETLHMRLTLLQMSFGKHIERKHVCFFAGEILDEVNRILHYIKVTPKLARPYKVTDELFDLSTMAMEYFKERIEPTLPEIAYFGTDFLDFSCTNKKEVKKLTNRLTGYLAHTKVCRTTEEDCLKCRCYYQLVAMKQWFDEQRAKLAKKSLQNLKSREVLGIKKHYRKVTLE